jgi:hypothetical protein
MRRLTTCSEAEENQCTSSPWCIVVGRSQWFVHCGITDVYKAGKTIYSRNVLLGWDLSHAFFEICCKNYRQRALDVLLINYRD